MYIIVYHDDADENEDAVSAPVVFGHKEALFGEWGQSCTSSAALDCILLHYYCNIALLYFCTIVDSADLWEMPTASTHRALDK